MNDRPQKIPVAGGGEVSAMVVEKRSPVVVIATHPWGALGGSMDDPHPMTVCKLFADAGCSTARFNFRSGINRGSYSVADVKAVAAWFTEPRDGHEPLAKQVLLVGYSYGSIIAGAAAADIPRAIGYALIGPPIDYAWALYLLNYKNLLAKISDSTDKPKLIMSGTNDVFCSQESFMNFVVALPEPKTPVTKDGSDHFSLYRYLRTDLTRWIIDSFGVADMREFSEKGASNMSVAGEVHPVG